MSSKPMAIVLVGVLCYGYAWVASTQAQSSNTQVVASDRIDDDISLVIKTFDNPHNDVREQLADRQRRDPRFPHVVLLFGDLPEAHRRQIPEIRLHHIENFVHMPQTLPFQVLGNVVLDLFFGEDSPAADEDRIPGLINVDG